MANAYSLADLLDFLEHAGERGLMPAATAQALAVASRNVFGVLTDEEREDLSRLDLAAVVKRFNNKRAKEFNPGTLKEYGRRVNRAVDLFLAWRADPANFAVRVRATSAKRGKDRRESGAQAADAPVTDDPEVLATPTRPGSYQSAVPVRPGVVVSVMNIPYDLTKAEAERLANFVRMLAVDE